MGLYFAGAVSCGLGLVWVLGLDLVCCLGWWFVCFLGLRVCCGFVVNFWYLVNLLLIGELGGWLMVAYLIWGCIGLLVCVVGGCRFGFWCLCLTGCCDE